MSNTALQQLCDVWNTHRLSVKTWVSLPAQPCIQIGISSLKPVPGIYNVPLMEQVSFQSKGDKIHHSFIKRTRQAVIPSKRFKSKVFWSDLWVWKSRRWSQIGIPTWKRRTNACKNTLWSSTCNYSLLQTNLQEAATNTSIYQSINNW